ncbi:hypothetical protein MFM001_11660 [Mycobacterium sp. MFM001]|nr:hypothetical protein MFM001_11660 [Mycobacterium sp. MFM001]
MELGAALSAEVEGAAAADDDTDDVAELVVSPAFSFLDSHPVPINATTAIAAENTAVRFVIARISFLSIGKDPPIYEPKRRCYRDRRRPGRDSGRPPANRHRLLTLRPTPRRVWT